MRARVPTLSSRLLAPLLLAAALVGCAGEPDPRFVAPEQTLNTLFTVYDVAALDEVEVQRLVRSRAQFRVRDREAYEACFSDWHRPEDEGLAGFVFGRLATAKDHLRFDGAVDSGSVRVIPVHEGEAGHPIVLHRTDAGWKIALHESVPTEVRQQLYRVHAEALRRERGEAS